MKKLLILMILFPLVCFGQTKPHWLQIQGKPFVDVESYGAVGDGTTDDTNALKAAIESGNPVVLQSGKTYRISEQMAWISGELGDVYLSSSGGGRATILQTVAAPILQIQGTSSLVRKSITNATIDLGITDRLYCDTSGITTGMVVNIRSSDPWYYEPRDGDWRKGELHVVNNIGTDGTGNYIELSSRARDNYDVTSEAVVINLWEPRAVHITGINFVYSEPRNSTAVLIADAGPLVVRDCLFDGAQQAAVGVGVSYNVTVDSVTVLGRIKADSHDGLTCYGVSLVGSSNTTVTNSKFINTRRGVDISGGSKGPGRDFLVHGNIAESNIRTAMTTISGFGTHGPAENGKFSDNIVIGGRVGFVVRGTNIIIDNNTILGTFVGITTSDGAQSLFITNNRHDFALSDRTKSNAIRAAFPETFLEMGNSPYTSIANMYIKGNFSRTRSRFIRFVSEENPVDAHDINIHDNYVILETIPSASSAALLETFEGVGVTLKNSSILRNRLTLSNSPDYRMLRDVTLDYNSVDFDMLPDYTPTFTASGSGSIADESMSIFYKKEQGSFVLSGILKFTVSGGGIDTIIVGGLPIAMNKASQNYLTQVAGHTNSVGSVLYSLGFYDLRFYSSATDLSVGWADGIYAVSFSLSGSSHTTSPVRPRW